MSVSLCSRMFVAAAVISAVSLVGTSVPTYAQQQGQKDRKQQEQKKQKEPQKPQAQPRKPPPQEEQRTQPQKPQPQRPQPERPQPQVQPQRPQAQQAERRLPEPQQQVLIGQQQRRLVQYRDHLDQQQRLAPQQAEQLQQQHRTAQYGFQQQYIARLREQQLNIRMNYNYGSDPYFYTPPSYRYLRGGRYYETNEYGANVLREAVNYGYQEGFEAGRADRQDHWAYNYRALYAYQDANYGFRGFYIERNHYNYYFRQGFRRGYEDGYYSRYRYGSYSSGRYIIRSPVLSGIISFRSLR